MAPFFIKKTHKTILYMEPKLYKGSYAIGYYDVSLTVVRDVKY